jgi:hypothetical protein
VSGGLTGTAYNGNEYAGIFGVCSSRYEGMIVHIHRVQFGSSVEYCFNAWNPS